MGIEHFQAGRYAEAELSFSLGYELSRKPGFLWNMAEAARALGAGARALEFYRRYLKEAEAGAPRLEHAREWVRALEKTQAKAAGAALSPEAAASSARTHELPGPAPGRATDAQTAIDPGARVPPEALRDRGEEPAIYERWWFWTGAGALVAASVLTAVLIANGNGSERAQPPMGSRVGDLRSDR